MLLGVRSHYLIDKILDVLDDTILCLGNIISAIYMAQEENMY